MINYGPRVQTSGNTSGSYYKWQGGVYAYILNMKKGIITGPVNITYVESGKSTNNNEKTPIILKKAHTIKTPHDCFSGQLLLFVMLHIG